MRKLFDKYPITKYVIGTYMKSLILFLAVFIAVFAILTFTDIYGWIENALNLKYDSPFVLVPLYGFAALAVLSFVIGILMYFHKYKRSKVKKSTFNNTFYNVLNEWRS